MDSVDAAAGEFVKATEALVDWMNGNDMSADHAEQKPEDHKRLCAALMIEVGKKADTEIARLTDAIWEYGEHRKSCRIGDGQECDCGFFDIIKSLKE